MLLFKQCWEVNSKVSTFLEVGLGGNLVQGFRVYAWRAVPSFPQIALWGPSLAFWPQPFALVTLLIYFHHLISYMTQIGSYYIHIPCREDVREYDCWAKWPEDTITRTFILYLFPSQFFWSWKKLSTSRVKVQIGAFENKSKHPVSTGFSSVALSEESPLLSNGFKFPCELFNPSSAAILSNLLIPTYPLRRKLQDNTFCELSKDQAGRHGILCSKRS